MDYKSIMQRELQGAKAISEKADAEKRDLTPEENTRATAHLAAYKAAKRSHDEQQADGKDDERARRSAETVTALKAAGIDLSLGFGGSGASAATLHPRGRGQKWAAKATEILAGMGKQAGAPEGVKALLSGTISVPNLLDGGRPVEIDGPPTTLLDLIGRGTPDGDRVGNKLQYLRQTTRTNNARAVPDGVDKPVSEFGFGEVTDHFRIFANKTEDLPYRYLADYGTLIDVVKAQLAENTLQAIEESVMSGTGPDADTDDFVGILNTSGIQVQAYTASVLQTLSNAKYKFLTAEQPFNGWVLNPTDLQALELMRENGATGQFLFPSRQAIADFLGAPVVPSGGIPAGRALVGDFDQAELIPLDDDELIVDAQKRTVNNTFLLMYEGTYGFRVKKPTAFVSVDLSA